MKTNLYQLFKRESAITEDEIDKLFSSFPDIEARMLKCNIISGKDGNFRFTSLGELLFCESPQSRIYYFVDSYLFSVGYEDKWCLYNDLIHLKKVFAINIPTYDDRKNIIREEKKEIDEKAFFQAIGRLISQSNIYSLKITIDQDNSSRILTMMADKSALFKEDRDNLILFLKYLHLIDWQSKDLKYFSDISQVVEIKVHNNVSYIFSFFSRIKKSNSCSNLNFLERQIYEYISSMNFVQRKDILNAFGTSPRNTSRVLNNLVLKQKIRRYGTKGAKNSYYKIHC